VRAGGFGLDYPSLSGQTYIFCISRGCRQLCGGLSHGRLCQMEAHLKEAKERVERLTHEMAATNEQYVFFQRVRDHMVDVLECLMVKAPLIEEANEELREILVARAKGSCCEGACVRCFARGLHNIHTYIAGRIKRWRSYAMSALAHVTLMVLRDLLLTHRTCSLGAGDHSTRPR
jgi:hypothetical protein